MFIQCSDCDYKYIVNSADLKPDGRMVECANCNHRWYQEPLQSEELLSSSVPHVPQEDQFSKVEKNLEKNDVNVTEEIKNLPSTVVREKKVSVLNTFLVIFMLVFLFFLFWAQNRKNKNTNIKICLLYTSPSPRDATLSRMPSSA